MALRIYMIRGSPQTGSAIGVTFYRNAWTIGGTPSPFLGSIDKTDETANGYAVVTTGVGSPGPLNATAPSLTYVYPLETDLDLAGTVQVCIPCHADDRYVYQLVLYVYVTQGTSGLTRGTLLSQYIDSVDLPPRPSGPVKAVSLASPQSISTVHALAGDYIVFEVGIIARGPAPNNGSVNLYTGCKTTTGTVLIDAVDGAEVDEITASHAPWFEFALIPAPLPQPDACPPCSTDPGTGPDPVGNLPPWTPMCAGGGLVEAVADLADGEDWAA